MMCYKDMTFCPFHADCAKAATCHRPLTDEVRAAAAAWWPEGDAPICVFTEPPDCHSTTSLGRDTTQATPPVTAGASL